LRRHVDRFCRAFELKQPEEFFVRQAQLALGGGYAIESAAFVGSLPTIHLASVTIAEIRSAPARPTSRPPFTARWPRCAKRYESFFAERDKRARGDENLSHV
jgi:hypothetical protein